MRGAHAGTDAPLLGGFKWLPWGLPFAMCLSRWWKHTVGIQALWGLTTVVKQPGEIAVGTLKLSHIGGWVDGWVNMWVNGGSFLDIFT